MVTSAGGVASAWSGLQEVSRCRINSYHPRSSRENRRDSMAPSAPCLPFCTSEIGEQRRVSEKEQEGIAYGA